MQIQSPKCQAFIELVPHKEQPKESTILLQYFKKQRLSVLSGSYPNPKPNNHKFQPT